MKQIIKGYLKIGFYYVLRIVLFPMHICHIKKDRILFSSLTGGKYAEYSCNPKYICEYLDKYYREQFEIIWVLAETHKYDYLQERGMKLVRHFTIQSFYYLLTSKYVISNGSYVPWFPFRKKQVVINTWHGGGAYKRLDANEDPFMHRVMEKQHAIAGKNITCFVTSSYKFTQCVIRDTFRFSGDILSVGMPRNDALVQKKTEYMAKKVKKCYNITLDVHILLYAPTYREYGTYEHLKLDQVIEHLEKVTGYRWIGMIRMHRYEAIRVNGTQKTIDVAEYPDMQELLAAADLLITDYSSCIWDYSFLERPCYLYVPDLDIYRRKRGFYVDIEKWHIPYAMDLNGLLVQLDKVNQIDWKVRMEAHHDELESCETGHATKNVINYILNKS